MARLYLLGAMKAQDVDERMRALEDLELYNCTIAMTDGNLGNITFLMTGKCARKRRRLIGIARPRHQSRGTTLLRRDRLPFRE
jgi:hypothetical protein